MERVCYGGRAFQVEAAEAKARRQELVWSRVTGVEARGTHRGSDKSTPPPTRVLKIKYTVTINFVYFLLLMGFPETLKLYRWRSVRWLGGYKSWVQCLEATKDRREATTQNCPSPFIAPPPAPRTPCMYNKHKF